MRTIWFRGTIAAAAAAVAAAMLLVNYAFEAAGSITDVPPAGFLAGSLPALAVIYPALVAVVTGWALMPVALKYPLDDQCIGRCGGVCGLCGALVYFGIGAVLLSASGRIGAAPPTAWILSLAYIILAALGGRIGGYVALNRVRAAALRGLGS